MFSCVVPVKGARPFFDEAIESLRAQGFGDDLEIIVQDGDAEPDTGQSDALNKGFAKAKGEWFFWLNADDVLLPGALEKVRCSIAHGEQSERIEWIAGNQLLVDGEGKVLKCSVGNKWHDWMYRNSVPHVYGPSSFFRRELFERSGGFDTGLNYCMDWDLWIKFMKVGARFERLPDYLWAQRQWPGSKTQRSLSDEEMSVHLSEVDCMCRANHFEITRGGIWRTRVARLFGGCYLREFADGIRMKGGWP